MDYRQRINANTAINLTFRAVQLTVLNPTGSPLYIAIGSNNYPSAASADVIIPPATYIAIPVPPTTNFGVTFGTKLLSSDLSASALLTWSDIALPVGIANVNLPQVITNTLLANWVWTNVGAVSTTIYTPPAGKNTAIYQMWGTQNHTTAVGAVMVTGIRRVSDLLNINTWRVSGTVGININYTIPPITYAPQPIILGVDEQLQAFNGTAETAQGRILVAYTNF